MKDTGLLTRFYHGYQDSRRSRDTLIGESLRIMETAGRATLRQRFESFTLQAKKSSSVQRFEPCYQQIYPSKKRKASFKIPKKPAYIPAVYQKRTTSCRNKYQEMVSQPARSRHMQWPPLYPNKRKNQPQNEQGKSKELPPWLLPLYSCKSHSTESPSMSEARYSGAAFHRKMQIIESIKHIRANQPIALAPHQKEAKNNENTHPGTKTTNNAVEALKRKIDSMQSYLIAVKNLEAHRKRYERTRSNELPEDQEMLKQAYSRIYQTKPPRELRVMKSMDTGTVGPKAIEKPLPGTSNPLTEQAAENRLDVEINKAHAPKRQHEEGNEAESNISKQTNNKQIPAEQTNNSSLGQIHKESVVMIKQPSWKTQQIQNGPMIIDSKANQFRASTKPAQDENTKDATKQRSRNVKIQDIKSEEEGNKCAANAWTVESLKTRINVMKINKNAIEDTRAKKAEDMSATRNVGEIKPKISQVALTSFHKEVGSKYPINAQSKDVAKLRLGYQRTVGRRNFSTIRHPTVSSGHKRTSFSKMQTTSKKITWLNTLKKCFALERIRIPKCENWKETPREIPYGKKEAECISPAPVLWKPVLKEHQGHTSKHTTATREEVNPAIINAERRILASIGKLMTAKSQNNIPGVRVIDIEKKISKAKHKVDMMPWLKESKSYDNWQRVLQLKGCDVKLEQDEPRGTGYEWILKNKEIVEDLKRKSRCAAGKSLVPIEVKNSINEYKLPLKAEISRYRKNIDRKCSDVYVYSTSKRWYSSCYAGKHRQILPSTDVFHVKKRGVKTAGCRREVIDPGTFMDRKTRPDIELGNVRKYNHVGRKTEDPEAEIRPKKWAWKVPNKTRAFTARPTALTSPNKSSMARMSEMSSCALKKQVEELKRLIKKAREEVAEKTEETPTVCQTNSYENRLKRLINAAHNNARRMQIVEPKYTSENNMMANRKPSISANPQPIQYGAKVKSKPEVSVLKSLFTKNDGEPKSLADEILLRNNLTSLPGKKPEKTISSRVYIKLKSLVEAVKRKSAIMDAISEAKLLPPPQLKGEMSATVPMMQRVKPTDSPNKNEVDPVTVEILAERTPAPSNTIQLWKGESKPRGFEFSKKEPTYGDLMNLFSKAKDIFYYRPPQLENAPSQGISENWLSMREDVSKAAKAVSELKNLSHGLGSQQNFSLFSQSNPDPLTEFMMTKSKILPMELLKSDGKMSCSMWSNVPIDVQENGDLFGKTSKVYQSNSHPSSPEVTEETKPSTSNQYETSFVQEPRKFLFQKPLITWESITQNFSSSLGRNLFGKPAENPCSTGPEVIVNSTPVTHQDPKTEDTSDTLQQSRSETTHIQDNSVHCLRPAKVAPESSNLGDMQESDSRHNALSVYKETNLSSIEHSCVPNLEPLEDKVRKYENFYRLHFADDTISGFEHLHQVYGDLDKMNKDQIDNDIDKRMGTGKEPNYHIYSISNTAAQTSVEGVGNTVIEKNVETDFHGLAQSQSNHRFMTKQSDVFRPPHSAIHEKMVDASGNSQVSCEISNEAEQTHQHDEQICGQTLNDGTRVIRIKGNSGPFKECSDVQGAELLEPGELTEHVQEDYSARSSNEFGDQEKNNFDDLLSQDPTLNPEVVKKLKLPVIMSDDSHAEKNWYTKCQSGSHQNHFNE